MTGLHDIPHVSDLVAAVREFLEGDVMGSTEGRVQFHARVAARVLAMVEREIEAGDAPSALHEESLARLGLASDAELAAAIRDGRMDDRSGEVTAVVRESVLAKLAVANPSYTRPPTV